MSDDLTALLAARYGGQVPDVLLTGDPVLRQLLEHRSVRRFRPDAVSDQTLATLMAAAQSAASSSNLQACSVVAVRNPDTRAALAECAGGQAHVAEAPLVLMWLADLARLKAVAESVERPHAALDTLEMFLIGVIDAALAAQNAMVAARALGLSGCYIGGMRNQPERVAELLDLPPQVFVVFGMTLGIEDPDPASRVKPRLPQSAFLHQERYRPTAQQLDDVARYNDAMSAFYAAQHMNVRGNWSIHSSKRIANDAALTGRDRLREALANLGFALR